MADEYFLHEDGRPLAPEETLMIALSEPAQISLMLAYAEPATLIARMSNWQRKQWARVGYPRDLANLTHFANLARP